ncbi:MAG: type II secretion system protein J [Phycisphaeraceae bacterium]
MIRRTARPGFTLVEVLVAVSLGAVLMVAITSSVLLAGYSLPDADSPATAAVRQAAVLEQLSTELAHAIHVHERTATATRFTLADRDGDGAPERLRYAWSGRPGDPLTRQMNDQPAVAVVERVEAFTLDWQARPASETYAGPAQVTSWFAQWLAGHTDAKHPKRYWLGGDRWIGQLVTPRLPADALGWIPGRIGLCLREGEEDEDEDERPDAWLEVRGATLAGAPTEPLLPDRALPGWLAEWTRWYTFYYSGAPAVRTGRPVALVIRQDPGDSAAGVEYDQLGGGGMIGTSNGGQKWTVHGGSTLRYTLAGYVVEPGPEQVTSLPRLTRCRIRLVGSDAPDLPIEAAAELLARPAAGRHYWRADFAVAPTTLDANGDGQPDWSADPPDGGRFDHGVLELDATLHARPACAFDAPTVVRLRWQCDASAGEPARLEVPADFGGGRFAAITALLSRNGKGGQTLALRSGHTELVSVKGLPDMMIDMRLLIDPDRDTVHLRVAGEDRGTWRYSRDQWAAGPGRLTLSGRPARLDYIRVETGGGS